MSQSATILQVVSTFDAHPMGTPLHNRLASSGIAEVGFTRREDMTGYMVAPSWNTEQVAGTVVMVRVEDWLRDGMAPTPSTDASARKELQARVRDFASEIAVLAFRGQPVWFLACPSPGWFAEKNKLSALCRTYTNLLVARVKNVSGIVSLNWPAAASGAGFDDRQADESSNVPFTPEAFERLAEFISIQATRTLAQSGGGAIQPANAGSPELAAYLAGLRVIVDVRQASAGDRPAVDRIIRTAASFSLAGEKPEISDTEVGAILDSGRCLLVNVSDRMDNHGPSGIVTYRQTPDTLLIDAMSLSCTVLGKQVEYALLSALAQFASRRGCSKIVFDYKPSGRNQTILSFLQAVADPREITAFSLPVDMAQSRIDARAVNPGAWTLNLADTRKDGASV